MADLNGDHKLDLVVGASGTGNSFSTLLGNGDGTFQPSALYSTSGGIGSATALVVADVNGDGIPDVVFNAGLNQSVNQSVYVALGNADGTFQPAIATSAFCSGWGPVISVAVADLNGDGKPDLAAACDQTGGVYPSNIFIL